MENEWHYERPPTAIELVQNNVLSNLIRIIVHSFIRISFRYYHHFEVVHRERLRGLRSTIIVANHASHLDALAVFNALPLTEINRLRTFAAQDYFFNNPIKRGSAFFCANAIPVNRTGVSVESMLFASNYLEQGGIFLVFPEGTRSQDGELHTFRPGIGMLTLKARATVVPVYIDGTYASQKKGEFFPRPRKIRVAAGRKLSFPRLPDTRENRERVASDLEREVAALREEMRHG